MLIRTKKIRLVPNLYVKIALIDTLYRQWWIPLLITAAAAGGYYATYTKTAIFLFICLPLYLLFWGSQFYTVTHMEENQILFQSLRYQIDSKGILIQVTPKQGMPISWEQIKYARQRHQAFLLFLSPAQFIYLPKRGFQSPQETKILYNLLKRKKLL